MSSDAEPSHAEETSPGKSFSAIPQKRVFDEDHSPAIPSPLNPEIKITDAQNEDATFGGRSKPTRTKKETLKKREAKGIDTARDTPDPKGTPNDQTQRDSAPQRFKLGPPKLSDFEPARGPSLVPHHEVITANGDRVEFFEAVDQVSNKRSFRYKYCIADPQFPATIHYRHTDVEPWGPRMAWEDAAAHIFFDQSARTITTDKGFRMARANVAVREGRWYWECKIVKGIKQAAEGAGKLQLGQHVRMGWARLEASLDAPVGFDAYSYGLRDVAGEKVFMSRPKEFFPAGEGIHEGDVIGLEIQLPSEHLHRKIVNGNYNPAVDAADEEGSLMAEAANIVRDRLPIRSKTHVMYERVGHVPTKELQDLMNPSPSTNVTEQPHPTHPSPSMRTLPNSCIKIYKNGVLKGTAFENLLGFLPPASKLAAQPIAREGLDDGMLGYYPALSVFRGGAAEVNLGPSFWYPPPGAESTQGQPDGTLGQKALRPVSERYSEQTVEDIVWDVIDEVDYCMQDLADGVDWSVTQSKIEPVIRNQSKVEMKELLIDD